MKTAEAPRREDAPRDAPPRVERAAPDEGERLGAHAHSLVREIWGVVQDHVLLFALEAQRGGRNIARMVFAGVIAAVLAVTAWLALVSAVMFWLVGNNPPWACAFLAVAVLHVVACIALMRWIQRLAKAGMFPATLRELRGGSNGAGGGQ
jgi:uncharacterized membrane protein YqjE